MHGIILSELKRYVETRQGTAAWPALLENALQLGVTVSGHLAARGFMNLGMNAHYEIRSFPYLLPILAGPHANDLPVLKPLSLHQLERSEGGF